MECKAEELAAYIITVSNDEREYVPSLLTLNNWMFAMQLVWCKNSREPLFEEEFRALPTGPALDSIDKLVGWVFNPLLKAREVLKRYSLSRDVKDFAYDGYSVLRKKSPWDLACVARAKGGPWETVWDNGEGYRHFIPNRLIVKYATKGER